VIEGKRGDFTKKGDKIGEWKKYFPYTKLSKGRKNINDEKRNRVRDLEGITEKISD